MAASDLYRSPLPAAHTPRLPAYLLRRVLERMVRFSGFVGDLDTSVHMPVVSRLGAHDAAQCHVHLPS